MLFAVPGAEWVGSLTAVSSSADPYDPALKQRLPTASRLAQPVTNVVKDMRISFPLRALAAVLTLLWVSILAVMLYRIFSGAASVPALLPSSFGDAVSYLICGYVLVLFASVAMTGQHPDRLFPAGSLTWKKLKASALEERT
jgi:hypothetical protein